MISQLSKDDTPDGAKLYDDVMTGVAPSIHDSVALQANQAAHARELNLDDVAPESHSTFKAREFQFLKVKHRHKPVMLRTDDRPAMFHPDRFSHHQMATPASIRSFIGGLSHCYNNILMGIWGNATLIGMVLHKSDPFQTWLLQLEDLIQNGSNLLQLLFGYIAERRSAARQLRYRQLKIELEAYRRTNGCGNEFDLIEKCLGELNQVRTRVQLAASIARVIDCMQFLLQLKRSQIDDSILDSAKAVIHLKKIDVLLQRGVNLIIDLQYYAGVRIPIKKPVCLRSIIHRKADLARRLNPTLNLTWRASANIPRIDADRYQVEHAVDQVLTNAIAAIAEDGKIEIEINTLHSEAPHDRCGVHMPKDYAVVTIKDTGTGMTTPFLSRIFKPFFTGIKGQGRAGIGLSAATGIVRAHGGYIQVRSTSGKGTSFKIYLPVG